MRAWVGAALSICFAIASARGSGFTIWGSTSSIFLACIALAFHAASTAAFGSANRQSSGGSAAAIADRTQAGSPEAGRQMLG